MPRRSSALAKRLVEPTWREHPVYVETYGPEVAEVCSWADYAPDPEQELLLDLLFAIDIRGLSAIFEFDLCAARQQIKTGFIKQAEIGWLYVTDQRLIVHSAHQLDTTEETFNETAALIENTPALSKRLALPRRNSDRDRPGITEGNGRWTITLKPTAANPRGQRIKYKARSKTGGRGLAGSKVVLDEAQHAAPGMMGALIPVLSTMPDPQVLACGSGCLIDSVQWREMRDRGRAGKSPRQAWVEWGDTEPWGAGCKLGEDCTHAKQGVEGCALDDEKRWAKFMTALNRRVDPQTIRDFRQTMPVFEFARELMVWHEDPDPEVDVKIFGKHWRAAARPDAKMPKVLGAIGLAADVDRQWGSIAAAGYWGEVPVVGAVKRQRGVHWLVDDAIRIARKRKCGVVIDGGGPIADLVEKLELEVDNLLVLDTRQMLDAYALFKDDITFEPKKKRQLRKLYHLDTPELNDAHDGAVPRFVGDRALVGRKPSVADVSMLEGAIEARYGLDHLADFSAFGAADLAMCDSCRKNPHEDPDGKHDYLCPDCREDG